MSTSSDVAVVKSKPRSFLFENRAGPGNTPEYVDLSAPGPVEKSYGDSTRVEAPSRTKRGGYDVVATVPSGEENVTASLTIRYAYSLSRLMQLAERGCPVDVQIHISPCSDPRDITKGWWDGKIVVLEDARITSHNLTDLGALSSGDNGEVNEEVEFSAVRRYEIGPITLAARAASEITAEIVAVVVCDTISCGDCDDPSDGCQKVYAVNAPAGSSPGLVAEVVVSDDGFKTVVNESTITTLAAGEDPDDAACVGGNLVVVSEDSLSLHYADLDDLIDGTETWAEVTTGFVAAHGPRAITNYGPFNTWIAAAAGYVYFTSNPVDGVEVQDAATATTEDLNDIEAWDLDVVVAVGANNAVIYTVNGGDIWQSVTGPAVGVSLTAVALRSASEWWIGTAGGRLYYTTDSGIHWTEKSFHSNGSGSIDDIVWASDTVGYFSHTTATPSGRILRTVTGGYEWVALPNSAGSIPAADGFNSLAVCEREPNIVYAGGLADNGADGVLLKGTST